ncbi:MAG: bile acid:sodium symporter family protein [Candidatus Pelagibacter sp.]|tara:strand:+ start:731 stop:1579 length:849 start_codon:yes stop_codon:yes gene_type:complete
MEIATTIAPFALGLIMLGLGLGLRIDDFKRVFIQPRDFCIGLICQVLLLPIFALVLVLIFEPPAEIAVGFMIIAAAPGGVTSNILTKFANGDVALSISLTGVISLLSIITVPLIIINSAQIFGINIFDKEVSVIGISLKMFIVVTLPVILGMLVRNFASNFVQSKSTLIERISIFLFLIVFASIWIEEWDNIIGFIKKAGVIALILNLTMMVLAFYIAKYFSTGVEQQRCISLECGLQNGTLAAFVGTQFFQDIIYLVPAAAYALIMFVTSLVFVFIIRNIS